MDKTSYLPRDFTGDLVVAARLWRRMTRTVTARHGIAEAGAAPLIWLGRMGEGVRQNKLAERCGIEGASLVRIIDDLTKAGLAERRPDAADRRANLLHLTDKGREVTAQVEIELISLRESVLGGLDAGDIAGAQRVIAAIKAAANDEMPDGGVLEAAQ
jgi:MarR family transcriptional regulator for hemolysin